MYMEKVRPPRAIPETSQTLLSSRCASGEAFTSSTSRLVVHISNRTLLEYAFGHGYSGQVSVKILNSPTTKDFIGILTFLYNQIDPNYTIVKLEEDAINLFKSLR